MPVSPFITVTGVRPLQILADLGRFFSFSPFRARPALSLIWRNDRLPVNCFTPFRIEALLRMSSGEGTGLLKTKGISFLNSVTGCGSWPCGGTVKRRAPCTDRPLTRFASSGGAKCGLARNAVHLTILGLVDCPISLCFFSAKRAVIRVMRSVFLPPLQGSPPLGRVPRVPLRCTLGYDPAPLRGLTVLSVTTLGPGAAERSGAVTAPSRSRLKGSLGFLAGSLTS